MGFQVGAVIRRAEAGDHYNLVIRWLDDDPTNLPQPDDQFVVIVRLNAGGSSYYLNSDGVFDPSGSIHNLQVAPLKFAMIDPPRERVAVEPMQSGIVAELDPDYLDKSFFCSSISVERDRFYNGRILQFLTGALAGKSQLISAYEACSERFDMRLPWLTFAAAWSVSPAVGDQFQILEIGTEEVAVAPNGPVDCALMPGGNSTGRPIGICNILGITERSFIRRLAAQRLLAPMQNAVSAAEERVDLQFLSSVVAPSLGDALSEGLASLMVDRRIRPRRLLSWLEEVHAELVTLTEIGSRDGGELILDLARLLLRDSEQTSGEFENDDAFLGICWTLLHIVVQLFRSPDIDALINDLDCIIYEAQQTRDFLSLRSLQGGELVDFWCNPRELANECADASSRGLKYPAAELAGLGCTVGRFTDSDLDYWITRQAHIQVKVELGQRNGNVTIPTDGSQLPRYAGSIRRARAEGSSLPPTPPSRQRPPRLNFDFLQSNVEDPDRIADGASITTTHVRHVTGDGLIQVLMQFDNTTTLHAAGFNVYGMWESPETEQYFRDPTLQPVLQDLRRWLITRRYSVSRDLANSLSQAAISRLNQDPPSEPVFFRPSSATDHGPVNNQTFRGVPLPVNVQNPGALVFAFDLRRGTEFADGWDPRGRIDTSWSPRRRRDGNTSGDQPQGYRFWVTSIDTFGQESSPVPVRTADPSSEYQEEYIYRPVYRTPLPPPAEPCITYESDLVGLVMGDTSTAHQFRCQESLSAADDTYIGRTVQFISGRLADTGSRTIAAYDGATRTISFSNPWPTAPQPQDSFVIRSPQVVTVTWSTPPYRPAGRRDSDPLLLLPKTALRTHLQLYRCPIAKLTSSAGTQPGSGLPDVGQWERMDQTLREEGWSPFRTMQVINGSDTPSPEKWSHQFTGLEHADKGYKYIAAISLEVVGAECAFWAHNVTSIDVDPTRLEAECRLGQMNDGRCVQRIKSDRRIAKRGVFTVDEYDYRLVWELSSEYPIHSEVARTEPSDASNVEEPRGVENDSVSNQLLVASQILPAGPVRRDAVLTRLLTARFTDGTSDDVREEFRDTGLKLTPGQAAMIDSAIIRSGIDPNDPANRSVLVESLSILAQEVVSGAGEDAVDAPPYLRHSVVGFRGLIDLAWTYCDSEMRSLNDDEAEAQQIVVDLVRVPQFSDLESAAGNVDAKGVLLRRESSRHAVYEMHPLDGASADAIGDLAAIVHFRRSGAVRISAQGFSTATAIVIDAVPSISNGVVGSQIEIQFLEDVANIPKDAKIQVFFAVDIVELPLPRSGVLLPVGGGPAELFCWSINTMSATGRRSDFSRRRRVAIRFPGTIEPPAPTLVSVFSPTDERLHRLDKQNPAERQWLPADLQQGSTDSTTITPHLVVSWRPLRDPSVGVAIFRRDIFVGAARALQGTFSTTVWQAVDDIEHSPNYLPVPVQWLRHLVDGDSSGSQRWLLGERIRIPNDAGDDEPHVGFRGVNESGFLRANTGIRLVAEPGVVFTVVDSPSAPSISAFHAMETLLVDGLYNEMEVEFISGSLTGQRRTISTYKPIGDGGEPFRLLQFESAWQHAPQTGDQFVILYKAGFIDYYRLANDDVLAMNVDYEYDYQICHYVDLAPQMPHSVQDVLTDNARFLRSSLSPLLHGRPETAPIRVIVDPVPEEQSDSMLMAPAVTFRFSFVGDRHISSKNPNNRWRYRILVKRLLFFSLVSAPSVQAPRIFSNIGRPLDVSEDDLKSGDITITDENIERADLNSPLSATYEITVSQLLSLDGSQEQPVRSLQSSGLIYVDIPVSQRPDAHEVRVIRDIEIR